MSATATSTVVRAGGRRSAGRQRARVAVVTDALYPYHRGGKEMRYEQLLPRLQESVDVEVFTMHWWPERGTTRVDRGVTYHAICPLFPLYGPTRRSIVQAVVFAVACLRLLGRRFDVVEADHMPYLQLFSLRVVTWLRRRPLVVTWNEFWGPEYWREYLGRWSGALAWVIERRAMRLPDRIVAISPQTAERVRAWVGEGVVREVPMAIDLPAIAEVEPAASGQAADLLCVGRLLEHKRVDLFLEALTRLPANGRGALVVGDGPERARLEAMALELGLADRVRFRADVVDHAEVIGLMKAARLVVLPSVREGFGLVVLEALACGTPVVATSHPDNHARVLVERSVRGYVAEPTPEGLTGAIERALAEATPGEAEDWIEAFDWGGATEGYLDSLLSPFSTPGARRPSRPRVVAAATAASETSPPAARRTTARRPARGPSAPSTRPRPGGTGCSRA